MVQNHKNVVPAKLVPCAIWEPESRRSRRHLNGFRIKYGMTGQFVIAKARSACGNLCQFARMGTDCHVSIEGLAMTVSARPPEGQRAVVDGSCASYAFA